jgi:PAS domain S-box-containing protein
MRSSLPGESEPGKTPLRVLFFEDDAADVDLSLRALRSSEFEVSSDVAVTPEEFLEHVRSRPYDVILSDFRMPRATGMDIFELVKKEGFNVPFILVTGSLGDEKAVECLKEGVADYVIKDRLARLPVAIRRALEEQRLRTERAQAEDALRRSEASYRSLIQSAPCGILRLSAADGRLLEGNSALSEMLGYESSANLLAGSVAGGIALDREVIQRLTTGPAEEGALIESEVAWKRKDGTPLIVGLRGRLLRDESGTPACFEMIAENLTERRQAQTRICQLNRLYSVLSHAGQAMVHIRKERELFDEVCRILVGEGQFELAWIGQVDPGTRVVTPVACYPREQAEYVTGLHIIAGGDPAELGAVGSAIRLGQHVLFDDLREDARMQRWRKRVQRLGYHSMGAFPIVVRGGVTGTIAIYACEVDFFDTENVALLDELAADLSFALESMELERMRQHAVAELDQFFDLSLDLLCICNLDGYMRRLNPAWEKTLGFSAAELGSKPWIEFVHPEDRPRAEASLKELRSGIQIDNLEIRFLSKSGAYRWLVGSATPALEQGVVFAAVRDITERKHLEEQLRSQNVALEEQNRRVNEASRLKSEFLANMSHELRSPLNGILGFTELLYDCKLGPIPERPREFLGRIHTSASHLLQLINGVLDLSKVEAGRLEFRPERVSVSSVIQEVIGILGTFAAEKQIRLETEIDDRVDQVITDPGRLKQILHNYLSNALKFTGPEGRVVVRLKSQGTGEFRLEVSDSGIGIAEKDFARLFIEFQQLDATKAKRYQGTGLGLALTKRIVEAQGGRVGVESQLGQGSTFFAVLPRAAGMNPAAEPVARILIIENDKVALLLLTRALEDAGYRVETAGTCQEAVDKCRHNDFDAITLDLLLDDGSGWEALRTIRSLPRLQNKPVIVVSALEEQYVAIPEPVQGFLTKPIAPDKLVEALEQAGVATGSTVGAR